MSYTKRYYENLEIIEQISIERIEKQKVLQILELPAKPHVLITGETGAGKSVLLRQIADSLEDDNQIVSFSTLKQRDSDNLVPQILSELVDSIVNRGDLAAHSVQELTELRATLYSRRWTEALAERFFKAAKGALKSVQRLFIFLDGIDEIRDELLVDRVLDWAGRLPGSSAQLIIAGRPSIEIRTRNLNSRFNVVKVGPLSRSETDALAHQFIDYGGTSLDIDSLFSKTSGNLAAVRAMLVESVASMHGKSAEAGIGGSAVKHIIKISAIEDFVAKLDAELSISNSNRLLCICALIEPVPLAEVQIYGGLSSATVQKWILSLISVGVFREDGGIVYFENDEFRRFLLSKYVLTRAIEVSAMSFGNEAAETDQLFNVSFVEPVDILPIIRREKRVVLGDRGAGKSAIFRAVNENIGGHVPANLIVVGTQSPNDFLQTLSADQAISSAEKFKAFWLLFVAVLAAEQLQGRAESLPNGDRFAKVARELLHQINLSHKVVGEKRYIKLLRLARAILPEKVSFSVGPVKVDQNLPGVKTSKKTLQVYEFLENTDDILGQLGKDIVIIFDQIDESFKYERVLQEALVQGLMLAESYLSQRKHISLIVLLRSDLYELYDIQEKNKFVSRTAHLRWSTEKLLNQLLDRTFSNGDLDVARNFVSSVGASEAVRVRMKLRILFPDEIEGKRFQQWLFDGLENASKKVSPRQIILFLNLLKDQVHSSSPVEEVPLYTEANVANALTELSEHSYREVISDFRVAVSFVQGCRAGKITKFQLKDVGSLFNLQDGSPASQIEQLQKLGFLELSVVVDNGIRVAAYSIPSIYTRCWF